MSDIIIIIPLHAPNGVMKSAIVDLVDMDLLSFRWRCHKQGYGVRNDFVDGEYKAVLLHRIILERKLGRQLTRHERVDHVDCKTWNNTRQNLRLATYAENARNRSISVKSTSGYKGVHWDKKGQRWNVVIQADGVIKQVGRFRNVLDAARAYNRAAIQYHGEFARLNVIPEID